MPRSKPLSKPLSIDEHNPPGWLRLIAMLLGFHRHCGNKSCRRGRRCANRATPCFDAFWPLVPERTKDRLRAMMTQAAQGGSAAAIDAAGERAVARYDAVIATVERHAVRARCRSRPPRQVLARQVPGCACYDDNQARCSSVTQEKCHAA